ncbi:MAG: sigma-54 factor interaction domain-containing protein [Bacillota bacterium]|nr:sigma-54 factor interaction domain-containing protein [Bacillota bacterium]
MLDFDYRKLIDKSGCINIPRDFSPYMSGNLITVSKRMKEIVKLSKRVALTEAPVLISGSSGVGKEVLAELIHRNSKRSSKPFIKLNCAAIPENLIESEFFGYEAGAFTGALKNGKKGVIELAENGTLFLDEIGEMALPLQAKLLRVLQDGRYRKVGGERQLQADIRIIAATNKSLEKMIEKGTFREDLYFRLNVILIHIPALKDRKEDIPILSL